MKRFAGHSVSVEAREEHDRGNRESFGWKVTESVWSGSEAATRDQVGCKKMGKSLRTEADEVGI